MEPTKSFHEGTVFDTLKELSAETGANPELVQGAGGNISTKQGDNLLIKASGTWLKDALDENIFVSLALDKARQAIKRHGNVRDVAHHSLEGPPLRPSIETALHVLMPQTVVIHVHCVNTIAYAVREDAVDALARPLAGLNWTYIPYAKPGPDLSTHVQERLASRKFDVLVLGNHGLVVGGDSVDQAAALLDDVHRRLAPEESKTIQAEQTDDVRLDEIAAETGWRRPLYEVVHRLALDEPSLKVATGGSLYPDHVVFLGRGVASDRTLTTTPPDDPGTPKLRLLPGVGALVSPALSRGGEEMARALALVAERVRGNAALRYLTRQEEDELLDWDAEKYRQNLED